MLSLKHLVSNKPLESRWRKKIKKMQKKHVLIETCSPQSLIMADLREAILYQNGCFFHTLCKRPLTPPPPLGFHSHVTYFIVVIFFTQPQFEVRKFYT